MILKSILVVFLMRIEQLEYLDDIYKTGSINKTAQHFYLSQQAVSNSIRQLERELGCSLLSRSATGVTLTKQGLAAVDFAQSVLLLHADFLTKLDQLNNAPLHDKNASLNISCSSVIFNILLPNILSQHSSSLSIANTRIMATKPLQAWENVQSGVCDLALISANRDFFDQVTNRYDAAALQDLILLADHLMVCISATSPYIEQATIDFQLYSASPHTIFGITPSESYSPIVYQNSISVSNDIDFHKKIIHLRSRLQPISTTLPGQSLPNK